MRLALILSFLAAFALFGEGPQRPREPGPREPQAHEPGKPAYEVRSGDAKILLLPFQDEGNEPALAYLKTGIPDSLAGYFSGIGFIEDLRAVVYLIRTEGPGDLTRGLEKSYSYADVEMLRMSSDTYDRMEKGDYAGIARRTSARFLISGTFRADPEEKITEARKLHITALIYDGRTGSKKQASLDTTPDSLHEDLASLAATLRTAIPEPPKFKTSFVSPEPGIMIFLNDRFLGRTPLELQLPAGPYTLRLEQEGRQSETRALRVSGSATVQVSLAERRENCSLRVVSEPEGASVFYDLTPIGKTPLEKRDLPCGAHRVRIALEGHIDRFAGVELKNGEEIREVSLALEPGDTVKTYRDPGYVIADWTRKDLSFYTALNSLVFYGGWMYYQTRANQIQDSIRWEVPYLAFWQTPYLTLYQGYLIEQNRKRVLEQQRYAKTSAWIGSISLVSSGLLLWRHYAVTTHESGEISAILETGPDLPLTPRAAGISSRENDGGGRVTFGLNLYF